MDEVSPTKDPQEPGMFDVSPPETGAELGAESSAKPSTDGPSQGPPATDTPADV